MWLAQASPSYLATRRQHGRSLDVGSVRTLSDSQVRRDTRLQYGLAQCEDVVEKIKKKNQEIESSERGLLVTTGRGSNRQDFPMNQEGGRKKKHIPDDGLSGLRGVDAVLEETNTSGSVNAPNVCLRLTRSFACYTSVSKHTRNQFICLGRTCPPLFSKTHWSASNWTEDHRRADVTCTVEYSVTGTERGRKKKKKLCWKMSENMTSSHASGHMNSMTPHFLEILQERFWLRAKVCFGGYLCWNVAICRTSGVITHW